MLEPNWAWLNSLLKTIHGSIKLGEGVVGKSVYLFSILLAFAIFVFAETKDVSIFGWMLGAFFAWYLISMCFSAKYPWLSILSGAQLKSFLEFKEQSKKGLKNATPPNQSIINTTNQFDVTAETPSPDPSHTPQSDESPEAADQ